MSKIDYYQIALDKAKEMGYDIVRPAGERDGWKYFGITKSWLIGHKIGLPRYLKISDNGREFSMAEGWEETMWALKQEEELSNLWYTAPNLFRNTYTNMIAALHLHLLYCFA